MDIDRFAKWSIGAFLVLAALFFAFLIGSGVFMSLPEWWAGLTNPAAPPRTVSEMTPWQLYGVITVAFVTAGIVLFTMRQLAGHPSVRVRVYFWLGVVVLVALPWVGGIMALRP